MTDLVITSRRHRPELRAREEQEILERLHAMAEDAHAGKKPEQKDRKAERARTSPDTRH